MDISDLVAMRGALWPEYEAEELVAGLTGMAAGGGTKRGWIARSEAGEAIGFAEADIRAYPESSDGPAPYLAGIWVREEWRGRGVASALLAAIEAWVRAQGYDDLASDVLLANRASHAWHRASGFAEIERIVLFRKEL